MSALPTLLPLIAAAVGIALLCLGGALAVGALVRQRAELARLRNELAAHAHRLDVLERDFAAVVSCARRIGERLGAGERTQRTLQQQLDRLKLDDGNDVAVEHALKLLQSGLALGEVTRLCDLTAGEVEILDNLARHRQAA